MATASTPARNARFERPLPGESGVQNDAARDRQIGIGAEPFIVPGMIESETLLPPSENRRSASAE
jgi:hypothetical protein